MSDLMASLRHAPKDSCPGPSKISVPLLQACSESFLVLLCMMLNMCLDWGTLPQSFREGFIFPIPKKGKFSVENSRPISLLEIHLKLLTRIINRRLVDKLLAENFFSNIQFGFLPGRSCPDAFHILYGVIEDALENGKPLHLCLVDLTKAFDSLSPEALQKAYVEAGLSERCRKFLGSLDGNGVARVLSPFGPSDSFHVEWGVRQGEVLSPTKFIIWLNTWLCHVESKLSHCAYKMTYDLSVGNLAFADDLAIPSPHAKGLQTVMHSLGDFCFFHGVTISCHEDREMSKTVYVTNRAHAPRLRIAAFSRRSRPGHIKKEKFLLRPYPRDHIFKYLGGLISLDLNWSRITKDVRAKLQYELGKVIKKRLTLCEAISVASSVVQGKGGYYLQLGQYNKSMIKKLDQSFDKALRIKAGAPAGSTSKHFHAPLNAGGSNVFWFDRLKLQSCSTELIVRLNSKGLVGEVARERWDAANRAFPNWILRTIHTSQVRCHYTLYCALALRTKGFIIYGPDNEAYIKGLFHQEGRICDRVTDPALLREVEEKGYVFISDLYEADGRTLKPWLSVAQSVGGSQAPAHWYIGLGKDQLVIMVKKDRPPSPGTGEQFFTSDNEQQGDSLLAHIASVLNAPPRGRISCRGGRRACGSIGLRE